MDYSWYKALRNIEQSLIKEEIKMEDNEVKFIPCKNVNGLYFILSNNSEYYDSSIVRYIGIGLNKYRFKLVSENNAIIDTNTGVVFFKTMADCKSAIEWVESMRVMYKLSETDESLKTSELLKHAISFANPGIAAGLAPQYHYIPSALYNRPSIAPPPQINCP